MRWLQELSVDPATIQTVSECELAPTTHPPKASPLSSSYSNFVIAAKMLNTERALSMHLSSHYRDGETQATRGPPA